MASRSTDAAPNMAVERDAPGSATVFSCRPGRCAPHLSRSASCVYVRVSMKFMIKSAEPKDEHFLWQMLYEAAHMDEAGEPVEAAKHNPALARYVAHWGQEHDVGYIAIDPDTGQMVAAAWFRLLHGANKGYGYVSDKVPELAIGARPAYRGQGAGTALMEALSALLQGVGRWALAECLQGGAPCQVLAKQGFAADCQKPTLVPRCGFRQRLKPSVGCYR